MLLNGLQDRVALHRVALGDADGEIAFTVGRDTTNHVLAATESAEDSETVPVRRFDQYFDSSRPGFLKIDVEGFEAPVLAGASAALQSPALFGMLVEDNGGAQRYGRTDSISALMLAHGFTPCSYEPRRRELLPHNGGQGTGNVLFLRDPGMARARIAAAGQFRLVNGWI